VLFYYPRGNCEGIPYNVKKKPYSMLIFFLEQLGIPASLSGSQSEIFMARICEVTGKGPIKGSHIWRSGKAKKKGGIGTHVTAITKRRFMPNLQRVKVLIGGEVRYVRVTAKAIKKGMVTKAPKRRWTKETAKAA